MSESARYAPVTTLMLYLTEDCNLRCTYCFVDKKPRRMTVETARKAVDWFVSRDISGAERDLHINFFGGEPFMELELMEEVVAYARQARPNVAKRLHFSATTNGTIANERVGRLVADNDMALLISLDGGEQANLARPFVSGKASWHRVTQNVPRLATWSRQAAGRVTFHPDNLNLVDNVQQFLALGVDAIALCPVQEAPWAEHEAALIQAYEALADWYIAEARGGRLPPLIVTNVMLQHLHRVRTQGTARPCRPCGVGDWLLGVDPDGNVMPCHRFLYRPQDRLGTVDSPVLSEKRELYLRLHSRHLLGCDTCPAERVCGGGCRVVVLLAGLDIEHDAHPNYCITMRAHARAVYRIYDTLVEEQNRLFTTSLRLGHLDRVRSGPLRELAMR